MLSFSRGNLELHSAILSPATSGQCLSSLQLSQFEKGLGDDDWTQLEKISGFFLVEIWASGWDRNYINGSYG